MSVLRARGVAGGYDAADVVADVDVELGAGRCLALVGPNGAGKSTLLRLLAGVLPVRRGAVELLGRPLGALRRREVAVNVALVPQQVHFAFPLSVEEVVEQGRAPHLGAWRPPGPDDRAAVAEAIARLGLGAHRQESVQRLSGGERQRVLLARALATRARALLLDEPASGLDARAVRDFVVTLAALRDEGTAIVLVVHDWNLALELADDVLLLAHGRPRAHGAPLEALAPDLLHDVFGVDVDLLRRPDGRPLLVPR